MLGANQSISVSQLLFFAIVYAVTALFINSVTIKYFLDSSKTASLVHLIGLAVGRTNHIISSNHPFIYAIRNAPDFFFLNSDLEEYFLLSSKTVSFVHFFCITFIFVLFKNSVQRYRKIYYTTNNFPIIIIYLTLFVCVA
ncbi:Uncharacterised protein [Segatella copri]|nr:Uncharacterised protein [Segatella copri]